MEVFLLYCSLKVVWVGVHQALDLIYCLQVIVVPLLDGILGAVVPSYTWFGALMSLTGVGLLESSGSPPTVSSLLFLKFYSHLILMFVDGSNNYIYR